MNKITKIVFVSNFFNHHQKFLSDEFRKMVNEGYKFIATRPMSNSRKALGWKEYDMDYIIHSYKSVAEYQKSIDLINNADVVIYGSAPEKMIKRRIKSKKLTFKYSERIYKKKCPWYEMFLRAMKYYIKFGRHKNLYLLCASAYSAIDYIKMGSFLNKTFKWGYFPETKKYNIKSLLSGKQDDTVLWVGRIIDWKHPENAIEVAYRLKMAGYTFSFNIVGTGEQEEKLKTLISEYDLGDFVKMVGAVSSEEVRKYMEESKIFLFTSDRNEGWGAVLNESMNSACAVIASHAAGATPFLIDEGKNGMIYESENVDDLYKKLKYLLDNKDVQKSMGENAYRTIVDLWSPENAARRFVALSQAILDGENLDLYSQGPCSRSLPLKDNWYNSSF